MSKFVSKVFSGRVRDCELGTIHLSACNADASGGPLERMRILGNYALVYTLEGPAHYVDVLGTQTQLQPGDLLVVYPDVGHAYGPPAGQKWSEFFIEFNGAVFDLWRRKGLLDPRRPIHRLLPIEYWLPRLETLGAEGAQPWQDRTLWQLCGIQQLLAEIHERERTAGTGMADREWLDKACAELERDLEQGSSNAPLHTAAKRMKTSYETFRKRFVLLSGVSPARYRMQRLMRRACELLQSEGATNKGVAAACGFCDEFHFAKRFKQVVGAWPRDFRRQVRG